MAAKSAAGGSAPNPNLEGHFLLVVTPFTLPQAWVDQIHKKHPGLRVASRPQAWDGDFDRSTLTDDEWKTVTILLTGSYLPLQQSEAPNLQVVQLMSAGANHVLKHPLFADTDIVFCTANGVHGPQISEWVIATFLAFNHKIPQYLENQHEGTWHRQSEGVADTYGQRIGILGYGSIGRQIARLAKALGMDVHAYTLHARDTPESRRDSGFAPPGTGDPDGIFPSRWFSGASKKDLHAFLASGLDLLVVATPLTDSTQHLLGTEELKLLGNEGRAGFLSNIARGPVVDTAALIDALDQGVLRGAALDVTDPEPLPDGHALWKAKNVIITPHVSGGSTNYNERVLAILQENLQRLADGRQLVNEVSRREGY